MIPVNDFIGAVKKNADRVTMYKLGYSGTKVVKIDGKDQCPCDCIGLDMGAYSILDVKSPWAIHGTNYTVRKRMRYFGPVTASMLKPGMLVFKARFPGEKYYDLPSYYSDDKDLTDYYHVGTVISVSPLDIVHCTSVKGGIKHDKTLGTWNYGGMLKDVGDEGDESVEKSFAMVVAESGSTVNLRNEKGTFIKRINVGTTVEVLEKLEAKSKVYVDGKTGYIQNQFLKLIEATPDKEKNDILLEKLKKIQSELDEVIELIK